MRQYMRKYPLFSLCGLNCGLCPRYHTNGKSKCPGCGGTDFCLKHPTCAVMSCNIKHDFVEFCSQCGVFPCKKYQEPNEYDSFITYLNVARDLNRAQENFEKYKKQLEDKINILEFLLENYNNGKLKNYYCLAVNLLSWEAVRSLREQIKHMETGPEADLDGTIKRITDLIKNMAQKEGVKLKLRKKG